jgi:cytochrome-b5 reductase
MLQPYASKKLHFIGSAYSEVQGWTEGAIQTAFQCYSRIFKSLWEEPQPLPSYTLDEVALHNRPSDGWIALFGHVYDVSPWIEIHPGGSVIEHGLGKDATQMFLQINHSMNAYQALQSFCIGLLK